MSKQSLEQVLQSAGNTVRMLREGQTKPFPGVSNEYTHWIEEQRSWQESCSLADQSHHMTDLWVEGPDGLEVFTDLGVNSFENFEVGQAKQFVACNPDEYVIPDGRRVSSRRRQACFSDAV